MAIHEVWVRRIVVHEETVCIPVEIDPQEVAEFDPGVQDHMSRANARRRALQVAQDMIANDHWGALAHVETLVIGEPKVTGVSGDVLADEGHKAPMVR
jgi:hypothetical protein